MGRVRSLRTLCPFEITLGEKEDEKSRAEKREEWEKKRGVRGENGWVVLPLMWIHPPNTPQRRSNHEKYENRDPKNPMVEVGKIRCLAQYIHMSVIIIYTYLYPSIKKKPMTSLVLLSFLKTSLWYIFDLIHLMSCANVQTQFSSFQSFSHVRLFATPWTAARQASLSITISWSLLKLMSIESVMPDWLVIQPSHPLSSPSPPAFNHSQHQGLFQ